MHLIIIFTQALNGQAVEVVKCQNGACYSCMVHLRGFSGWNINKLGFSETLCTLVFISELFLMDFISCEMLTVHVLYMAAVALTSEHVLFHLPRTSDFYTESEVTSD